MSASFFDVLLTAPVQNNRSIREHAESMAKVWAKRDSVNSIIVLTPGYFTLPREALAYCLSINDTARTALIPRATDRANFVQILNAARNLVEQAYKDDPSVDKILDQCRRQSGEGIF